MRTLKRFHMAMGFLPCCLGLFNLSTLSLSVLFAAPLPNPLPASTQATNSSQQHATSASMDSLSRSLERLTIQVDSELKANNTRIEAMKEATDRSFWTLVILGIIGSIIGGAFVLGERAQERQHHKDYTNERAFYEQRTQKYEQRQQELHELMQSVAQKGEKRNETAHVEIVNLYQNQVKAGRDAIEQTSRLFALVEANFAKINEITTAVANGAKENVSTLNAVLASFQQIMQFKVTEAQLVEQIRNELNEMERTRKQQIDELLKDAIKLIRKRFEFTNPDAVLQRLTVEFRTKMDNISMATLMKYTRVEAKEDRDWRYGEIFLRRGVIAYCENDPLKAREMFKIAEEFFPFSEQQIESMSTDQRYATAFSRYYLALVEKNYGDIRQAKNYIEDSYLAWGKDVDNELLTPTTRAEILSYAPGGIDRAREALAEILLRATNLKKGGRPLLKHDAICTVRAHLLLGNTYYLEKEWEEALRHYRNAAQEDTGKYYSYYACHSIAQALRKLGKENDAEVMLKQALQHLVDSGHLASKVALDSRIMLNALAYLCTRAQQPEQALHYKQAIMQYWLKIQKVEDLELRLFSLEQKRQVSKEEFWSELFHETISHLATHA